MQSGGSCHFEFILDTVQKVTLLSALAVRLRVWLTSTFFLWLPLCRNGPISRMKTVSTPLRAAFVFESHSFLGPHAQRSHGLPT
jgi:hypothetical protein